MTPLARYISLLVTLAVAVTTTPVAALPNPLNWFGSAPASPGATPGAPAAQPGVTAMTGAAPASFAPIAHAARPAVVNVSTSQTVRTQGMPELGGEGGPFGGQDPFSQFFRHFMPEMPRSFTQRALGSGVIIGSDGYIVTNAHVAKGADKIVIKLEDKREFDAKVVGIDEKTDVALLKIEPGGEQLHVATLGDSDALQVGDWVVAIGNPFGLSATVTAGICSAKGRVIGQGPYDDFIQTDASINPGNSGGPLLDLQARVIGINASIFSQSGGNIGIGFAIPINLVKNIVEQLKAHGKVIRGWLGVSIQDVTPALAKSLGLQQPEGALVADVTPDSPAAHAGVQRGDLIIEFNGTHIDEAHQLPALVAGTKIGQSVPITLIRNGKTQKMSVTVAEMPAGKEAQPSGQQTTEAWGLEVADITPELARQLGLKNREGVVITGVAPDSPADNAGLQAGDVILQVNREPVHNTREYQKAVASGGQEQLLLLVNHQGQNLFVALSRAG